MSAQEKLCFLVCWEDKVSDVVRNFHLNFYPADNSVDMYDLKIKKMFLKKTITDQVNQADLYIGNTIVLYSRVLRVLDFGDEVTRNNCSQEQQSTFALIKPGSMDQMGNMLAEMHQAGFTLARAKMVHLNELQAGQFYSKLRGEPYYPDLVNYLSSGCSLAIELVRKDAVQKWRELLGPIDSEAARDSNPETLRARFGQDDINNVAHGSTNVEEASTEVNFFFPKSRMSSNSVYTPATHFSKTKCTTCCVIKPHAMHLVGAIIEAIKNGGFQIFALETFHLDFGKAEEFLEVYKGVLENYGDVVKQLSSGMCLAMEIGLENENSSEVVMKFREFCGPQDSEIAKLLRPMTLRARFGENLAHNAIHCTDLPEDGPLEVEYFFRVLQ
eukprot:GFUD01000648.1.p1 GENE.GFUD01000648.1~~GFUD01000648.1.p1  ORF type:complete len:385 (+),score=98.14 GFUD01000648.1:37-1191(+)